MERATLIERLRAATHCCVQHTQKMVTNRLPEQYLYVVNLNQSYDGNPLHKDEVVFPEDTPTSKEVSRPRQDTEVADVILREGRVPEWINVIVRRVTLEYTFVSLDCCGRYTSNPDLLYYKNTEWPPFGVKGAYVPRGWKSVEESGRFDLHWKENS